MTIASGDFVVGYSYATGTPGANFDTAPAQNRSYRSNDGTNFIADDSNYMIRAQIFTGNCTPASCGYNINPTTQNFAAAGGNGTVNITTGANCAWAATRSVNWINFTSPPNGAGNGAVNFTVAANNTALARTGTITVGEKTFTVTQDAGTAPTCFFTLNPAGGIAYGSGQQTGRTFNVITAAGCQWTAAADQNWVTVTGGSPGTGNGTVTFDVAPNPNPGFRRGSITVAGVRFTFDQFGGAPVCNYALNPANVNLGAAANAGNTFAVNVGANCAWTATTNDNWITITGGGTGNGTVTYSLTANAGAARNGTITVQGQNFAITQAAGDQPCTPVTGGLLNWYRAENNANDVRTGNNGTVAGNLAYGEGNPGQTFVFNGTNSVVSIGRTVSDSFTIEFWFRTTADVTGGPNEIDWRQGMGLIGTANDDFGVSLGNGKILFGVGDATIAGANAVNDDMWYHVVATRIKETGAVRLYINGANPVAGMGNTNTLNSSPQLLIGRRGPAGAFFNGRLDEVKIYTGEFSDDQAQAAFQGCNAGQPRMVIENRTILEGNPGQNNLSYAAFTVRLSQPGAKEIGVHYFTEDLTAIDGVDYVGDFGSIAIQPGETVGTIFIPILTDTTDEPDRQFLVILYDPINGNISDDEGVGTILDDDTPCETTFSAESISLSSASSAGNTFSVNISAGCGWTASGASSWISLIGNSGGNGSGTVTFSVAANTGVARTGIITAAGRVFTVNQAAAPNAMVSVFGRVANQSGSGVSNAIVVLTDAGGAVRRARTSSFGYYRFDEIQAGQTATVAVASKRWQFSPQTISATAELNELNFIAGQ